MATHRADVDDRAAIRRRSAEPVTSKPETRARARRIAAGYAGAFPFMVDMRLRALRYPSWLPTVSQTAAILRCANRDDWTRPTLPEPDPQLTRRQQAALDRETRYLSGRL